ncbi:EamA family transporter RarD [Brevundimonas sp.]|uniref:EamA family transporter RarD n=1 Tax=Brevundimonas sp. TaxID=1871086 RepID=UPI003BA9D289
MSSPASLGQTEARNALIAGIGCYLMWGFIPLVFQAMARAGADPFEIMAHRTAWAVPLALLLVLLARQGRQVMAALKNPKVMGWIALSSTLIAINWTTYVIAVNHGRMLDASLGYYLNPLLNMAAGAWLFRERISRFGMVAIGLAGVGVVLQGVALGHLPWVALILAFSFCGYGVIRKRVAVDAQSGLFLECLILGPIGLAWVLWITSQGQGHFGVSPEASFWLLAGGPVTVIPMVLFAWAARRMPLSTMGFLQFIAPTMVFVFGVMQGEPFGWLRGVSFAFIWAGAAVYAAGALVERRHRNEAALSAVAPEPGLLDDPAEDRAR